MISEQILEIRIRPDARVLDNRGTWAELIAQEMELEYWKIVENRIDLSSKDKKISAFISFRNFGLSILDAPTDNYFRDKAIKLIGIVSNLPDFQTPLSIERFGIRKKLCTKIDADLATIASVIRHSFIIPEKLKPIGGEENLVDAAVLLYFRTPRGQVNIRVSSNDLEEIKRIFNSHKHDELPKQGWICDIDYYRDTKEQLLRKEVVQRLAEFSKEIDQRISAISSLLEF